MEKETTIDDVMDVVNFEFTKKWKRTPNLMLFPTEKYMKQLLRLRKIKVEKDGSTKTKWKILGLEVRVNANIPKDIVIFAHRDQDWKMREVEMFNLSNLILWKEAAKVDRERRKKSRNSLQ